MFFHGVKGGYLFRCWLRTIGQEPPVAAQPRATVSWARTLLQAGKTRIFRGDSLELQRNSRCPEVASPLIAAVAETDDQEIVMDPPYVRMGGEAEAEALLKQPGPWTVGGLQQSIGWTQELATVNFKGHTLVLLPETKDLLPAIAVRGDHDQARRLLMEFASALTWSDSGAVTIQHFTGGSHPHRVGKSLVGRQIVTAHRFQISYLPMPEDANTKLALALYHEGLSLAQVHVAYSFLSFYKIINLVGGQRGADQIAWINERVPEIKNHGTAERLNKLRADNLDIGNYLYQSGRCAVAHAGDPRNPVVDPHNVEDQKRLHADLPLIINLAQIAIEEMGVKTSQTVYREHRYELSAFEQLFDSELVEQLKLGGAPAPQSLSVPPCYHIRIWGKDRYKPLENMIAEGYDVASGVFSINCRSESNRVFAIIRLDFPNYRLKVDVGHLTDDGSPEFIDEMIELSRYFWEHNGNGCLEVWTDENVCLGRRDAFIPVNVMFDPKAYENEQAKLAEEAARRRAAKSG